MTGRDAGLAWLGELRPDRVAAGTLAIEWSEPRRIRLGDGLGEWPRESGTGECRTDDCSLPSALVPGRGGRPRPLGLRCRSAARPRGLSSADSARNMPRSPCARWYRRLLLALDALQNTPKAGWVSMLRLSACAARDSSHACVRGWYFLPRLRGRRCPVRYPCSGWRHPHGPTG
jgi:hypothetical protein